jgi:hypothetical protein
MSSARDLLVLKDELGLLGGKADWDEVADTVGINSTRCFSTTWPGS